jgi:serine/threonine-protein kinase RsbT
MERIPILQMGPYLLVTIQVDMHDQLALTLQDDLAERISKTSARGVLIDISALDMVDIRAVSHHGRPNRVGRHAACGGHHLGRAGHEPAGREHRIERGAWHAPAAGAGEWLMNVVHSGSQPVRLEQDVVLARQTARKLAQDCGMRLIDLTKLVTAVSELARNTVVYGGGGDMDWQVLDDGARKGLRLTFRDEGPGIPDLKLALTDGWTSGNGLGLGLTGARRLVEEFELDTAPGQGTRVTITRWT